MTQGLPSDPALLPTILRILEGPVVMADGSGAIVHTNEGARNLLGWDAEALRGQMVWEALVHPDRSRALETLFHRVRSGESTDPVELQMATSTGEERSILWTYSVVRDEEGHPRFVLASGTDVTRLRALEDEARRQEVTEARRAAREEALRVTSEKYSGIIQIASEAIISIDADHRILMFNKGAEEVFGYASEEVLGEPLDLLIPTEARRAHRSHVDAFGDSSVPARRMGERTRISGLRKGGETFPAEASILKLDVGGERLFTVVLRDIGDRVRQVEEQRLLSNVGRELQRSLDYETTLRNAADATLGYLADFAFIDIVDEDGAVRRLQAVHRDAARADVARDFSHRELDRDRLHLVGTVLMKDRPELVQEVTPEVLDRLAQSPDQRRALERLDLGSFLSVPLEARGRTIGTLFCARDRGRTPLDEQHLALAVELGRRAGMAVDNARLYRDARRAVEARDDVLGVVSHDLGNPLQAIFIGLEALERSRPGRAEGRGGGEEYYLTAIRRSADTMQRLIRDLLEVRRMEAGHLDLERRVLPIGPLIDEALQVMDPLARVKGIELVAEEPPPPHPEAFMDPDRIQQVLSNLLGNAVKHTPEGGRVEVVVRVLEAELDVRVRDTGPGIPEEHREKVFNRFWRDGDRRARGIGLGLAIARGIVQAHGGRIGVEAAPAGGSEFRFSLPLADVEPRGPGSGLHE